MTATATERTCPKCGGAVYDNRAENIDRAERGENLRPEFKCKSCEWVKWPPKNGAAKSATAAQPAPARQAAPMDPNLDESLDSLFATYDVCYAHALTVARRSREKHDLGFTAEGVAAIAATLLIAAQKKGIV